MIKNDLKNNKQKKICTSAMHKALIELHCLLRDYSNLERIGQGRYAVISELNNLTEILHDLGERIDELEERLD